MSRTDYIELIQRELSGHIDSIEKERLDAWIDESEVNARTFRELRQLWEGAEVAGEKQLLDVVPNTNKALERVRGRLGMKGVDEAQSHEARRIRLRRLSMSIAASVVMLIAAGIWWKSTQNIYQVEVAAAEVEMVMLPDGSTVTLRGGSQLAYQSRFVEESRLVKLEGEAFFDISHDPTKPFRVITPLGEVEVLGTRFNVSTVKDDKFVVHCKSGKVQVSSAHLDNPVILEASEQLTFDSKDSGHERAAIADDNYLSWKTGKLYFKGAPLEKVIEDLSKHFGVSISVENESLYRCHFDSDMENQSIQESLEELKIGLQVEISKNARGEYIVTGAGICQ